jgi:hypothetical protein
MVRAGERDARGIAGNDIARRDYRPSFRIIRGVDYPNPTCFYFLFFEEIIFG